MKHSEKYRKINYIRESARALVERAKDQGVIDNKSKSHVLKHDTENEHVEVNKNTFKLLVGILKITDFKRKML